MDSIKERRAEDVSPLMLIATRDNPRRAERNAMQFVPSPPRLNHKERTRQFGGRGLG